MSEMTSKELRFAALTRDMALRFFAANPTVRLAVGRFGVRFYNGLGELDDNMPDGPCACLLTPMLLLRAAYSLNQAFIDLAAEHGVSEDFLSSLAFGWDVFDAPLLSTLSPAHLVGKAIRTEIEISRRPK
jgi:hypothetical protein